MTIAKTSAITGSSKLSTINFNDQKIRELNLTLNGTQCHGYPVKIDRGYPIWPYFKFYDTIGKLLNVEGVNQQSITSFKNNVVFAHKFEGEESIQGIGQIFFLEI